ncbi:MAG: hypothetical protein ACK5XZ_07505 [Hyphomonadaceae bacterium]|jgi:hypothetical protein|nr:hypothetical protein [Aquidulcibacter sp.]
MGVPLPLKRQYKTIETDAFGTPLIMSYLGAIVDKNNRKGEPGAICGGGATSPFNVQDRTASTFSNTIELTYTLEQKTDMGIKADLTAAMVAAGVPVEVTDRIQADLETSIGQLRKQVVNATATLSEYQLKPEVLSELDSGQSGGRLSSCLTELKTGTWRMYQAASGFYVSEGRLDSTTTNTIIANLVARVRLADPNTDTAALTASLSSVATQRIKTASKPYFVVIGVSFYDSPRHPEIR